MLYKGHAIAAVAATNVHAAEEALALIDVRYEVLPAVRNVREAMAEDAPLVHEDLGSNVTGHTQYVLGDVEEGFQKADLVVEREFYTDTVHQGYIEPHTATAWWGTDKITVWCSSQGHFQIGEATAEALDLPSSQVKVVPMEIGGGFGGKTTIYLEPVAALLSLKSGAPVKVTMTRAEVMEASGPTGGSYMKVKIGTTNEGRLTAAAAEMKYESGAFPGSSVGGGAACIFSPYDIENIVIDAYDVIDNKPKTAAYRAPGAPGAAFAAETVLDEIAQKLSIDPMDLRIVNGAKEGSRRANGIVNPAHRRHRDGRGSQGPRALLGPIGRAVPGPRRRVRLLDQRGRRGLRDRQRQLRRHGEPGDRVDGHRGHPPCRRSAARRGTRHPGGGRQTRRWATPSR